MKFHIKRSSILLFALIALGLAGRTALADFTFVQISDTHIDAGSTDPGVASRYAETIKRVNALNPAFVIHTGDALANFSPESLAIFKKMSDGFKPRFYAVPGNHDVGNKPSRPDGTMTEESYNAWVKGYGYSHVSFEQEGWVFIGLTSTLFTSGFAADKEQYDWLKAQLKAAGKKPVIVFMHHPIFESSPAEPKGYNNIDEPVRSQLLKLFKKHNVKAFLYGHLHRLNESHYDGISFIATPSTAFSVVEDHGMTGYRVFRVTPCGFTTNYVDLRSGGEPPKFE